MNTPENPVKDNYQEYLQGGEQTVVTERIQKAVEGISGSFEDKIKGIFKIVANLRFDDRNKKEVFRKRTADEIISDGYVVGCSDRALVMIALARALGFPAKYIETIDKKWLNTGTDPHLSGHVYVGVLHDGKWVVIDSNRGGRIGVNIEEDGRVVCAEGLDSWAIGVDSFDALKKKYQEFLAAILM